MEFSTVFKKTLKAYSEKPRIILEQGGTSSSKTFSILQLLIIIASKHDKLISVVSETLPHLKRGAMRDFFNILIGEGIYREKYHNKTDNTYQINNSKIEFFSADNPDKIRGARRDILFINECNNVSYPVYDQLEVRTKETIFLDYNPVSEFWAHEKIKIRDDVYYIQSTYKDNEFLDEKIVTSIESRKDIDPNWWRVYGLGETGSIEGLVFTNWEIVDEMPEDYKKLGYGLDFGFTNDPTALIEVGQQGGFLWLDEKIYETALTNDDIYVKAKKLKIDMETETIADSAEPKSIEELYRMGWNVKPAVKGRDSINSGIDILKSYQLKVTKNSVNLIKELRNYKWAVDKHGKVLNKPIDNWNHAIDGVRYLALMKLSVEKNKGEILDFDIL